MASKMPEKILVNSFLDKLEKSAGEWTTEEKDGHQVIKRSAHNTALVMRALRESARDAGYISLMFALVGCETEELPE